MSVSSVLSYWVRQWGIFFFYFFAVGAIGVITFHAGVQLTNKVISATANSKVQPLRQMSRVERHLRERERLALRRVQPPQENEVVALVRPAVPPSVMAAQLDRVETAVAKRHSTGYDANAVVLASCASPNCTASRVRGWKRTAHPSKSKANTDIRVAAGPVSVEQAEMRADNVATTNPAKAKLRIGTATASLPPKKRTANPKLKPQPHTIVAAAGTAAIAAPAKPAATMAGKMNVLPPTEQVPPSSVLSPPKPDLRVADTPGEIVRISLLGNS